MAKQKNNKNDTSSKNSSALSSNILRCGLISLLVMTGSFLYLAFLETPKLNNHHIDNLSRHLANSQTMLLNQTIESLQFRIAELAKNPQLIEALERKDQARLVTFQIEAQRNFPAALSVKLIPLGPLGIAGLHKEQAALRNNIELDMLRRASNDESLIIESYRSNKLAMFTLAQSIRIESKQYAEGALLISFNNSLLQKIVNQLDSNLGETQIIQTLGKSQTLVKTGEASIQASSVRLTSAVPAWELQFTPSNQFLDNNSQSNQITLLLLAINIFALVAALALTLNGLKRALADNLSLLTSRSKGPFSLPGFELAAGEMLNEMKKLLAIAKRQKANADSEDAPTETKVPKSEQPAALDLSPNKSLPTDIPETIFRAYDIRGLADQELTDSHCFAIGMAVGSEARGQGQESMLLAMDGRHSSPRIRDALAQGIQASGCDVIDIGMVPSPLMYFATHQLETQSGVMITGSHNPAEYNGIKIVINGSTLSSAAITDLRQRIVSQRVQNGKGAYRTESIEAEYIDYILNDVAIAQPLKIVIDAGNGVTGEIAPKLFEELGCEIVPLYCEIDGDFPNHHPDPAVAANMQDLIAKVKEEGADLGIAFDGDGDRLGVVTAEGNLVPADRLLMLLAQDVVSRNPGADILFDVKCTRSLNSLISNYGGRPIMWKTGHSFMKEKMAETGALLGGEFSGHIFFKERWFGFDDGMYAAARLIEILSTTDPDLDAQLSTFPETVSTPEFRVASDEVKKFAIVEQLSQQGQFENGKITTLDGVRVDFNDGWGLVRASNTTPMLTLRFEAKDDETLAQIQELFKTQLSSIDNSLEFNF
ncbi:MAG: phosphomannomutase/phosphoglucomutase [Pseudohongiellaceae bacterium]|jgi:phosphomannomutase/phosphoglucomutase